MNRTRNVTTVARIVAWSVVALAIFVTLTPIGLRPNIGNDHVERFTSFLVLGFLFALAYPRHVLLILVLIVVGAGGMEAAQEMIPGRHGTLPDFLTKFAGAVIGVGAAVLVDRILRRGKSGSTSLPSATRR